MSRATLKYVGVVLIVGGVILSTTGIGAFSTVEANRQMFVGVGGKSTSYLGISTAETTVTINGTNGTTSTRRGGTNTTRGTQAGTEVVLGSVTNYFPATLDSIKVTVAGNGRTSPTVRNPHVENVPLKSGSSGDLVAIIDCGEMSRGTGMMTFKFVATGTDTHATTKRKIPLTCVNKSSPSAPSNPPQLLSSPRQMSIGSA
jgi:hypothetical protein